MQPRVIETEEILDAVLQVMNEEGENPVLVGIDCEGVRFLVYGWAPGGDGWDINVCLDDPRSGEFSYTDVDECDECGSFDRLPLSFITFPIVCI